MAQYQTNASVRRFLYLQQYQAHPQWEDYCAHVWKLVYLHKDIPLFRDWITRKPLPRPSLGDSSLGKSMSHADFSTLSDMGVI